MVLHAAAALAVATSPGTSIIDGHFSNTQNSMRNWSGKKITHLQSLPIYAWRLGQS